MAKLRLTLACGDYDRTRALITGEIEPEGIDLNVVSPHPPGQMFWRMMRHAEFDASELSLSNFLIAVSRDDRRFVGLPIFTYRAFRHSMIWVNEDVIREPQDLVGKRVGIPEYAVTALLFLRGVLQDDYGVAPESIYWFRGRAERVELNLPKELSIEDVPQTASLDGMLEEGQLDAMASFSTPRAVKVGTPRVGRLFPNVRDVEGGYYRRTGIYPIMHLIVVRRDIYEENRWIAPSLMKAFEAAKQRCYDMAHSDSFAVSTSLTPWLRSHAEEAQQVFGGDLYPYGVEQNLPTLEAALRYSYEQHLSERRMEVDGSELFAPEALDMFGGH